MIRLARTLLNAIGSYIGMPAPGPRQLTALGCGWVTTRRPESPSAFRSGHRNPHSR